MNKTDGQIRCLKVKNDTLFGTEGVHSNFVVRPRWASPTGSGLGHINTGRPHKRSSLKMAAIFGDGPLKTSTSVNPF